MESVEEEPIEVIEERLLESARKKRRSLLSRKPNFDDVLPRIYPDEWGHLMGFIDYMVIDKVVEDGYEHVFQYNDDGLFPEYDGGLYVITRDKFNPFIVRRTKGESREHEFNPFLIPHSRSISLSNVNPDDLDN